MSIYLQRFILLIGLLSTVSASLAQGYYPPGYRPVPPAAGNPYAYPPHWQQPGQRPRVFLTSPQRTQPQYQNRYYRGPYYSGQPSGYIREVARPDYRRSIQRQQEVAKPAPQVQIQPSRQIAVAKPVPATSIVPVKSVTPKKKVTNKGNTKQSFLITVAPLVHKVNKEIRAERQQLLEMMSDMERGWALSESDQKWLSARMKKYRVKGELESGILQEKLLPRIDIIPVELALAQAANESAWGKSRFAREARNLFGVWTYDQNKGIVPLKRAKGSKHLVRKYESMEASIRHYMTLLNSHPAYQKLRDIRFSQRQKGDSPAGHDMAAGLVKYSAKGEQYVAIIRSMIDQNDLTEFRAA